MPILPSQKNVVSIIKGFRDNLSTRTSLENFERDSKIRTITDSLSEEMLSTRELVTNAFLADRITVARGADLDRIGERMGRPRILGSFAQTSSTEKSLAFFVETGTFGDINTGSPIVVPLGELVFSAPNNNEFGETVQFRTIAEVTLPSASTLVFFSCKAVISGSVSNVGAGVIQSHGFVNYTGAGSSSLKVNNFYPLLNGREQETDEQYRSRLLLHYSSLLQNNEAKIKLASLSVPGVVDVKLIDAYYGISTVGVIVLGPEETSTPDLVRSVQVRLDQFRAPGLVAIATTATQVSFSFELVVTPTRKLSELEKRRLTSQIKRTISGHLGGVGLQGLVDTEQLAKDIQLTVPGLIAMKSAKDRRRLFRTVYAQKGNSSGFPDERKLMASSTYRLEEDEYATIGTLSISYGG